MEPDRFRIQCWLHHFLAVRSETIWTLSEPLFLHLINGGNNKPIVRIKIEHRITLLMVHSKGEVVAATVNSI